MTDVAQAVTDDAFLGAALKILQPRGGYRAGIDAVLLAATAECHGCERTSVLDVGAGVGVVGLCVAARLASVDITLVEKQPELLALAEKNIQRNGLGERVAIIGADVLGTEARGAEAGTALQPETFDVVLSNPPFYDQDAMRPSANPLKAGAHAMPAGGLDRWVGFMARMTRPGGTATLIHRPEALGEVVGAVAGRFGDLTILPLYPRAGEAANRVIVRGRKGSRKPARLLPGVVLHGEGNGFEPEIEQVLRSPSDFRLG